MEDWLQRADRLYGGGVSFCEEADVDAIDDDDDDDEEPELFSTPPSYASPPSSALVTRSSIVIHSGIKTTSAPTITAMAMENATQRAVILTLENRLDHRPEGW